MSLITALRCVVEGQTDARPVGLARLIVGAAALVLGREASHISARLFNPAVVHLPYFQSFPYLTPSVQPFWLAAWFIAAAAFMAGWYTRLAGSLLIACISYFLLLDQQTYSNHQYLLVLLVLLLVIADSGASLSIDAVRGRGRELVPAWPVLLLKLQLSIVYGFAAIAKLNVVYLSGAILSDVLRPGGFLTFPAAWHTPEVMMSLATTSILTETFLALAFWSQHLRPVAVVVGVGLHAMMLLLLQRNAFLLLGPFAAQMFALYILFVDLTPFWQTMSRAGRVRQRLFSARSWNEGARDSQ